MYLDAGPKGPTGTRRIAVIGSGISGLSAAWLLSKTHDVTLYEADGRIGGHANTVDAHVHGQVIPVDTGFIVYNEGNYPNLVAMFEHLGVPTAPSWMSFGASVDQGDFEYCSDPLGLVGQKTNIVRKRFWRMLSDIVRFSRSAQDILDDPSLKGVGLADYVESNGYSAGYVNDHILPMAAAIWSSSARDIRDYPIQSFVRFFLNHGLLELSNRPLWRTVDGGSREYVSRLLAQFKGTVRLNTPVRRIERHAGVVTITDAAGHEDIFSDVLIATHADQALAMLGDADEEERALLGAFRYTDNTAVLHTDTRLMPKRKSVWSSWNYIGERNWDRDAPLCVTYWMNKLQNIDKRYPLFVTLNPSRTIDPEKILGTYDYTHPLFDTHAVAAQQQIWRLQGRRHTWFAGAHFGSGFHEDGLQSGLAAAEDLGGVSRPWSVANASGRIHIDEERVAAE
ncbi:NAD(P)/FAD-dependent oxidoreductase [Pelagibacterium luteolum]|uniref:Predicted NAD/FAD-binding protein n=1 Tax=Pelagibacterium luteolum TaxID=440168 RepID=A0A1G7WTF0_9HYPH|nr:FAD-dependent oxidoreductase [Pelagibacterium luteolum]SDG75192.1 Predicted NAD/FAD-binding protein [Pelagibacterium luteolum]